MFCEIPVEEHCSSIQKNGKSTLSGRLEIEFGDFTLNMVVSARLPPLLLNSATPLLHNLD